jgi:hypothetical protein
MILIKRQLHVNCIGSIAILSVMKGAVSVDQLALTRSRFAGKRIDEIGSLAVFRERLISTD